MITPLVCSNSQTYDLSLLTLVLNGRYVRILQNNDGKTNDGRIA